MRDIFKHAMSLLASMLEGRAEQGQTKQQSRRTKRRLGFARLEHRRARREQKRTSREYLLCRMRKKSVCAEIGVYEGAFSERILSIVEPRRLHLVDPWKHEEGERYRESRYGGLGSAGQAVMDKRYEEVRKKFNEEIRSGQVHIHRAASSSIYENFQDHYFDWIYLDGNHLYEFVKQDLEHYCPKVKPGGCITGDDYGTQGWWKNGVQRAVDEFVRRKPGLTLRVNDTQFIIEKGV
jgi:hypothetical protein